MAKVNLVEKEIRMELDDIIRFQLVMHCHLENISMSDADIKCMILLSNKGPSDLSEFCTYIAQSGIFKSTQTARNCLVKLEKSGLIIKNGPNKKRDIAVNPSLNIQIAGNILLNYKVFRFGTN